LKVFALNLSAPFLAQFFKDQMDATAPYWDYLFGSDAEALAYAESHSLNTQSIPEIAKHLALLPKANALRNRVVIITQGPDPIIVATAQGDGKSCTVKEFSTPHIPDGEIVDSNGAGDAFAGGYLAELILGGNLEKCIKVGQWLSGLCLRSNGARYQFPYSAPDKNKWMRTDGCLAIRSPRNNFKSRLD
jgi:adenosine kinase